jgi:two-component system response regulator QseB
VKPFDLDELSARIRALLRRQAGRAESVIQCGELSLNPATREASYKGRQLTLSAREFALLEALLDRPGAVLSREQLEEKLYGWDEEIESNTVEVYIHGLRKKLGQDFIKNIRGVGYMVPKQP